MTSIEFVTTSRRTAVAPTVELFDGEPYLVIEDGSVLIDFPLAEAPGLAALILAAHDTHKGA